MMYTLGIACESSMMKYPYIMKRDIVADSFDKASVIFMADASVQNDKVNNTVVLLGLGNATGNVSDNNELVLG